MAVAVSADNLVNNADVDVRVAHTFAYANDFLKGRGWTVPDSGEGFGGTGGLGTDLLTVANLGNLAHGAWARWDHTATGNEVIVQVGTTNSLGYRAGALWSRTGFTGGTPNENTIPTATDTTTAAGVDTTDAQVVGTGPTAWNVQIASDDASAYFAIVIHVGVNDLRYMLVFDALSNTRTGDTNPYVFWAAGGTTAVNLITALSDTANGAGYDIDNTTKRDRNDATDGFGLSILTSGGGRVVDDLNIADPLTGLAPGFGIPVVAPNNPLAHQKGVSQLRWHSGGEAGLNTINSASRLFVGTGGTSGVVSIPWDGATAANP